MAGTYRITIQTSLSNGNHKEEFKPGQTDIVQSAVGSHSPTQIIGTSQEDLSFGDIATVGRCEAINLDSTNYVDIGPKSGGTMVPAVRLMPGEPHAFRISPGQTWAGQANSASCKVQLRFYEN